MQVNSRLIFFFFFFLNYSFFSIFFKFPLASCSKMTRILYTVNTHPIWNSFMIFISWIYIFLAFFEPINQYDYQNMVEKRIYQILGVELIVLFFFIVDNIMDVAQRKVARMSSANFLSSIIRNKKLMIKIFINLLFITDFLSFNISYPKSPFRFSRIIRPSKKLKILLN